MTQDEIWITKDGTKIKVSDMSEHHVRNVLRMILRNRRLKAEEQAMEGCDYEEWGDFEFWK